MDNFKQDFNYQIPATIMFYDETKLPQAGKLIYGYIKSLCYKNGKCFASNAHIAKKYNYSLRTVSRLINTLEKLNLIECFKDEDRKTRRLIYLKDLNTNKSFPQSIDTDVYHRHECPPTIDTHDQNHRHECLGNIDTGVHHNSTKEVTTKNTTYTTTPSKTYPNLEQVMDYAKYLDGQGEEIFFDPNEFFEKYEACGWTDRFGREIKNWKRVFDSWVRNQKNNAEEFGDHNKPYKDFETPADRIKRKEAFIRDFKAHHKTFKCYCCGAEIESDTIDVETGFYHCSSCDYSVSVLVAEKFK
ncbi:MAG: helix-turn-helix domain-containing protein [Coriobacteriia bacterium]|nr:helix-turn-helix domain-containing protein [Coriobacteriia bacterium]